MIAVLVEAYSCEPGQGSEKGVGWNVIARLAGREGVALTVITRGRNRKVVEMSAEDWVKRVAWLFVDPGEWLLTVKRGGGLGLRIYHWFWGKAALKAVRDDLGGQHFDLVHRLTFGSILPVSHLAQLGLPLVVGPAGGGEMTPVGLVPGLGYAAWARDRLRFGLFRLWLDLPSTRKGYEACVVGLGATEASVKVLRGLGCDHTRLVPQAGCGGDEVAAYVAWHPPTDAVPVGAVKLVCASRLIAWKGVDLAVEAVAVAVERGEDVELVILGTGPEMGNLRRLVRRRGLGERVFFPGRLAGLNDVFDLIRASDALIHPALNEAFGQAVLESLALGRQVLCLDWHGPGMIVKEDCGLKVFPGSREEVVEGFARAIGQLRERRDQWAGIQKAAITRSGEFSWERVAAEIAAAYEEAAEAKAGGEWGGYL